MRIAIIGTGGVGGYFGGKLAFTDWYQKSNSRSSTSSLTSFHNLMDIISSYSLLS
jgi:hypothetical protein